MKHVQTTISVEQLKELLEGKELFREDAFINIPIEIVYPSEEDK